MCVLTDHACPELTVTFDQRRVVQSKENKCMDCKKYDDLKSRLHGKLYIYILFSGEKLHKFINLSCPSAH